MKRIIKIGMDVHTTNYTLGYSLYHELEARDIKCVILAPTTMKVEKGGK